MPLDSHSIHNAIVNAMENHNKDQDADMHFFNKHKEKKSGKEIA